MVRICILVKTLLYPEPILFDRLVVTKFKLRRLVTMFYVSIDVGDLKNARSGICRVGSIFELQAIGGV